MERAHQEKNTSRFTKQCILTRLSMNYRGRKRITKLHGCSVTVKSAVNGKSSIAECTKCGSSNEFPSSGDALVRTVVIYIYVIIKY